MLIGMNSIDISVDKTRERNSTLVNKLHQKPKTNVKTIFDLKFNPIGENWSNVLHRNSEIRTTICLRVRESRFGVLIGNNLLERSICSRMSAHLLWIIIPNVPIVVVVVVVV